MKILGIETSCDETSVAIVEGHNNHLLLKSNIIATSLAIHAKTGGVIPENAAREQIKYMLPVLQEALSKAEMKIENVDAIAVTYGPGLIGSLLVGVETARTLAYTLNKPLIPVNHMLGHVYATFIDTSPVIARSSAKQNDAAISSENITKNIQFSFLALVVSGGHTDLLLFSDHKNYKLLGGTRDDAAGEAYDKIGRLLGLPYPAGPVIEKLAKNGNPKRFRFPRPLIGSPDFDFSFSGLKTAVLREVQNLKEKDEQTIADISRATQDAIIDVLLKKTFKAALSHHAKTIIMSGGVAANQTLKDAFTLRAKEENIAFYSPPRSLCTDNAAMIAAAAYFQQYPIAWNEISANPELYFD